MPDATVTICLDEPIGVISPNLHGHFAEHLGGCIEGGIWVGPESVIPNTGGLRSDVLDALRHLQIPVLRWPGGCFADDYHWEDGVGPRKDRPRRVNLWWGQNVETNAFGTHEFIALCRYLGAEPYLAGNVGSGTVREMRDWVEYCNFAGDSSLGRRRAANGSPQPFGVRYWGVGNESWGCGGNLMPEEYATDYRRYATYLRDFGESPLYLIACGPDGNRPDWTRRFFTSLMATSAFSTHCHRRIHGLAAHYYCGAAGTATEFTVDQWYELLQNAARMEQVIVDQRRVMDEFDPKRDIGLVIDEWGTWHPPTPGRNPLHLWQQSTLRDALAAAITLDTFHRHADKVVMANLAQVVNVLQSLILTDGDRMVLTPTYHVFDIYRAHRGGTSVRVEIEAREIAFAVGEERRGLAGASGSASVRNGKLTLSLVNPHASLPLIINVALRGGHIPAGSVQVCHIHHDDLGAHNSAGNPALVRPEAATTQIGHSEWRLNLPAASISALTVPFLHG